MTFPTPYKPETVARAEMRHFLYQFDARADAIPKRIDPAVAERYLRAELAQGKLARGPAERLVELADFYDVAGIVPDLLKLLTRQESTEVDYRIALAFTKAIGILGTDTQLEFGRRYYLHLLALPLAERWMPDLLDCLAVYDSPELHAATVARMDHLLAGLRERAKADPAADLALRNSEDLRNGAPPRIEAATALKRAILATPDPAARLDQLVKIYLREDMRFFQFVSRWAVRALLREARAGRADAVVHAFRRALERSAGGPTADEPTRARRACVFHAIEFFGGPMTPQESAEMRPATKRFDVLSND